MLFFIAFVIAGSAFLVELARSMVDVTVGGKTFRSRSVGIPIFGGLGFASFIIAGLILRGYYKFSDPNTNTFIAIVLGLSVLMFAYGAIMEFATRKSLRATLGL